MPFTRSNPVLCIRRIAQLVALATVAVPIALRAQAPDTLSLLGRTAITFGLGLTGARSASVVTASTSTHTDGEVGALTIEHWVHPSVAAQFTLAVLSADASATPGHSQANAVTPLLFSLAYSPRQLALSRAFRPYVSAGGGAFVHEVADAQGANTTDFTETAPGGRFAAGANWFVSRHFLVNVEADYHAVGTFDHPDALTKKASGFGMLFALGFAWGGNDK